MTGSGLSSSWESAPAKASKEEAPRPEKTPEEESPAGRHLYMLNGELVFASRDKVHPITPRIENGVIKVGCCTISREAYKFLKRKLG